MGNNPLPNWPAIRAHFYGVTANYVKVRVHAFGCAFLCVQFRSRNSITKNGTHSISKSWLSVYKVLHWRCAWGLPGVLLVLDINGGCGPRFDSPDFRNQTPDTRQNLRNSSAAPPPVFLVPHDVIIIILVSRAWALCPQTLKLVFHFSPKIFLCIDFVVTFTSPVLRYTFLEMKLASLKAL